MLQLVRQNRIALIFGVCCVWIAAVSVHDAVLVVVYQDMIERHEQNPVGRWLIQVGGGEVWLFLLAKLAGTAAVCTVLARLYQSRRYLALPVAVPVASFQLLLLCYLHFR